MHSQLIRNFIVFSAIVVISVCIITVVVLRGNAKIDQSKEQIIYSHDLITLTKSLTSEIEAMLANQRGYFLTGDQSYLNDYTTSKSILDEYLSTLDIIAKDAQKEKLDTLKNQINLYVEKLDEAMANFKPQKSQLNSQNREILKQFSNTINDVNAEIVGQEYTTLNNRITYFQDKQKKYQETLLAIAFITGTLLIIVNIWL